MRVAGGTTLMMCFEGALSALPSLTHGQAPQKVEKFTLSCWSGGASVRKGQKCFRSTAPASLSRLPFLRCPSQPTPTGWATFQTTLYTLLPPTATPIVHLGSTVITSAMPKQLSGGRRVCMWMFENWRQNETCTFPNMISLKHSSTCNLAYQVQICTNPT